MKCDILITATTPGRNDFTKAEDIAAIRAALLKSLGPYLSKEFGVELHHVDVQRNHLAEQNSHGDERSNRPWN